MFRVVVNVDGLELVSRRPLEIQDVQYVVERFGNRYPHLRIEVVPVEEINLSDSQYHD